jgi:hypothetical protein
MISTANHFEYKLRLMDYHDTQKSLQYDESILDGAGNDGWDLASAVPIVEGGKTVKILYCMKKHSKRSMI